MTHKASGPQYTFLFRLITLLTLVLGMSATHLPVARAASHLSPNTPDATSDLLGPSGSSRFGSRVFVLPNGNLVVTDPAFGEGGIAGIGAVYLYDGTSRTQLSRLTGVSAGDTVGSGGVSILKDGNFAVTSPRWNNVSALQAGAVTWCSGTTGCPATVTTANSLVGSHPDDTVGADWFLATTGYDDYDGIEPLPGGAYLVRSPFWNGRRGAVTYCASGSASCKGTVSATNSLIGVNPGEYGDNLGMSLVLIPSGGYVVHSGAWDNGSVDAAGIVIPCPATGCTGVADTSNGLYGTTLSDAVGTFVQPLPDGGFVVVSNSWGGGLQQDGAVTYCASVTDPACIGKPVSASNSLTCALSNCIVGGLGVTVLPDGSYLVKTSSWRQSETLRPGALTYCAVSSGTSSCTGQLITTSNSLVGTADQDNVGSGVTLLKNGAFLVSSGQWHNWRGALTYCANAAACTGQVVSASNSLVGVNAGPSWSDATGGDSVANYGGIVPLNDGSYVVLSGNWDPNNATKGQDIGAATFCPATGCTGNVSIADSLLGTDAGDQVGMGGAIQLANGAILISSPNWMNGSVTKAGAITYCANAAACSAKAVSLSNSLVGDQVDETIGYYTNFALSNGAYLVGSSNWANGSESGAGALTWCPPSGCKNMTVGATNSLVGSHAWDGFGSWAEEVGDGLYVSPSTWWQDGDVLGAGSITLCGIGTGCTPGAPTRANSVIGDVEGADAGGYLDSLMKYSYDTVNHRLLVGKPVENKVVFFTLSAAKVTISGNTGVGGATLSWDDGGAQGITSDATGDYTLDVSSGWSGTVSVTKASYTFASASRTYSNVVSAQPDQDYTVTSCTALGSGTVPWSTAFLGCPMGAKLIIPSGLTVYLDSDVSLADDLEVQDGGTLDPTDKTVTLTGSRAQTLSGNPLNFYRLVLNKTNKADSVTATGKLKVLKKLTVTRGKLVSASDYGDIDIRAEGELELTGDISIAGNFDNLGTFTANGHRVTFDGGGVQQLALWVTTWFDDLTVSPGTTLVETIQDDNAVVQGSLTNGGVIRKTQTVEGLSQYYFGLAGRDSSDIEIDVTSLEGSDPLTAIQVDWMAEDHPAANGAPGHGVGWGHYWRITPTGSDFAANVTLPHTLSPYNGANACRFTGDGRVWDCKANPASEGTVTYDAATTLGDWAVGEEVAPNAVSLSGLTADAGPAPNWQILSAGVVLAAVAAVARTIGFRIKKTR